MRKSQLKTLKRKGIIKDKNVAMCVTSSGCHNYIDIDTTKQLNLFVQPTKDPEIKVAKGQKVKSVCRYHKD